MLSLKRRSIHKEEEEYTALYYNTTLGMKNKLPKRKKERKVLLLMVQTLSTKPFFLLNHKTLKENKESSNLALVSHLHQRLQV